MKRLSGFIFGFLSTILFLLFLGVIVFYVTAPDRYTLLVIGSDQRGDERARSDVLFLVSIPKSANEKPYFLTIPRDTKIDDSEWGLQKITHFYALGERPDDGKVLGNVDLTRETVEELLDVKVDATIEVTFDSFQEIIDTVGGVTLNGETVTSTDALAAVRDRFSDGRSDFDRQSDAREVMRSLMMKGKSPQNAKMLLNYFEENEKARFEYKKIQTARFGVGFFLAHGGNIDLEEMDEGALPGEGASIYTPDFGAELYYWVIDEEETQKIIEEHFK